MSKIKHSVLFIALLIALLALGACAPQVQETSPEPVTAPESVTLRLAIPDGDNVLYAPYVLEFIQQAKTLSNGTITIEPTWQAGDSTDAGYEVGVIQLVKEGEFDLGLAASRSFDSESITSFEALQAPFLIDNDALAKAVATSDAASRMLENLSTSGLAGLTLWPEDLRHPFSVDPANPLLSPDAFAGLTIRSTDTGVGDMLIKSLGGNPIFEASDYQGAESGLRQGAHLTGRPAATGNVTFFTKYQTLFANGAAFKQLSDAQRTVLQEAALAAQKKALAERPSDVEAGAAWCADGGTIVLASDEQIAAFQKASQPVFDKLQENSFNAESIAAISELKAKTQSSPSAQACAPTAANSTQASTDNQTWSDGLPPNGVWTVDLTIEDIIRMGVLESNAPGWAGLSSYEFNDGEGIFRGEFLDGVLIVCPFTSEVIDDFFRLTYVDKGLGDYECGEQVDDLQWRLDEEGLLHFNVVAVHEGLLLENTALYEARPWQLGEEWSQGLLPNGVWQATLTSDDLFAVGGILESVARENAGVHTFTFRDGEFTWTLQGDSPGSCEGTYTLVEDIVRLNNSANCGDEVDDIQWRLDDEGLHLHLVAIQNAPFEVIKASLEAKPFQKISD